MATTASVPLMVTRDMKQQLLDLGWSKAEIVLMTPEEIHGRIKLGVKKATIDANVRLVKEGVVDLGGVDVTRRNPVTGEMETFTTSRTTVNRAISPDKVQEQVTQPPLPSANVQHKIVTQKLQEPKQSDPGRMDSKTIRKKDKRRARAHKDVNPANVKINPETIKGQTKKRTRRERIAAKKDPSYVKYKKRQHTFRKKEWEKKDPESIKIAKENYIKNPSRIFKDDVKNVWEDIKNTGKRFYNDSPTMKTTKNLLSKKWFRGGLWAVGSTIAFNLVRDKVARALEPPRAIPEEYERGYDNIKQTLTDFGSPVKLAKAAQKVMVPYYSTTRSALRTNVNTVINHNYALASSKHAIRHMQY